MTTYWGGHSTLDYLVEGYNQPERVHLEEIKIIINQ